MQLPKEFIEYTSSLFGEERWKNYLASFDESVPVSVRLNPFKTPLQLPRGGGLFDSNETLTENPDNEKMYLKFSPSGEIEGGRITPVPWCRNAYYLSERPNFTLDPLLHAGVYYVQEAGSMFLDEVLKTLSSSPLKGEGRGDTNIANVLSPTGSLPTGEGGGRGRSCVLDLCAAPGGKSTLLRAALPDDVVLYSNEPDRRRANILMENIQKQGHPNVIVTNNYAIDYQRTGMTFDLIVCDVPCSGEGMFRKDHDAIGEWSLQNVMKCAALQRSIIEDIWPCLNEGGVMVYSTCTFNLHEDEENVKWICETLGAEIIPIEIKEEWNITGSLLKGWDKPVYRFIPGTTKGEGLFMAVLRKLKIDNGKLKIESPQSESKPKKGKGKKGRDGNFQFSIFNSQLRVLSDGHPVGIQKGKNIIPAHAEALLINLPKDKYPFAELSKEDALKYLHHEAIVLDADVPKGFVVVTYQGHPLGFVKNIGNRANNLYPQEWKIRNL